MPLINDAIEQVAFIDESAEWFYKMSDSDYIEWFDQLPCLGSKEIPKSSPFQTGCRNRMLLLLATNIYK